jgi:hypothetical protein
MVVVDPVLRQRVKQELCRTGRLPESVHWVETKANISVLQRLQLIAIQAAGERLVIMDGGTTYHASLLQKAKEWNDESVGLALKISAFMRSRPKRFAIARRVS